MKTHHWSGVTLNMKNMFGIVPGSKYGWPKNILHWNGIQQSILDVCATVPVHFVIADAIMAMEGNGPLNGTPWPLGRIVLADDPVAADATCARLTQRAADLLGMSLPFFVKLLETGAMAYHRVGNQRGVYLRDVLAYAHKRDEE